VAEGLNWMMQKVITDGTGTAAALDFTNVAGKTGTSTGPKDVWFVGFTGKYVASVWLGNDDNRPMASGTTGGHFAAPVFHSFMSVVQTDMNIPTIPGLEPHPVQVAEQQRIAAMHPEGTSGAPEAQRTTSSLMSDQTRDALRKVAQALRKAGGIAEPPPPTSPTNTGTNPPKPSPTAPPNRRADGTTPNMTDPRRTTLGVAQPPQDGTPPRAVP
jgi:penicillin-binding protein 1A